MACAGARAFGCMFVRASDPGVTRGCRACGRGTSYVLRFLVLLGSAGVRLRSRSTRNRCRCLCRVLQVLGRMWWLITSMSQPECQSVELTGTSYIEVTSLQLQLINP